MTPLLGGVLRGDLSPHPPAQVADFNLSRPLEDGGTMSTLGVTNPRWLAPCILSGEHGGLAADVWCALSLPTHRTPQHLLGGLPACLLPLPTSSQPVAHLPTPQLSPPLPSKPPTRLLTLPPPPACPCLQGLWHCAVGVDDLAGPL